MQMYKRLKQAVKNFVNIFGFGADQSRIKKKLMLYFLLISIVSISVSIELVWEVSEKPFRDKLTHAFFTEFQAAYKKENGITLSLPVEDIDQHKALAELDDLRIRMLLLTAVVVGNIFTAFALFSKDIARPIDALVEGAKKVSDGDLTAEVEVLTQDEIGQLAQLINDMNINLQELIMEIRHEMERLGSKIGDVRVQLKEFNDQDTIKQAIQQKTMSLKALKKVVAGHDKIGEVLEDMVLDLDSLTALIDMYKVYQITHTEEEV